MTRAELHTLIGQNTQVIHAAAAYLRLNIPRKHRDGDATSLINHEGWLNGYLDAIEALTATTQPLPEKKEKTPVQPYSQPENQNPNRK
jgi:hypothetical protein